MATTKPPPNNNNHHDEDGLGFSFVTPDWKEKLKVITSQFAILYNAIQDFIVPKYYHDRSYR